METDEINIFVSDWEEYHKSNTPILIPRKTRGYITRPITTVGWREDLRAFKIQFRKGRPRAVKMMNEYMLWLLTK